MITILTSTYNRAYTLERLYKSLVNQQDKDFEWVLVDDGSTDNSKELIQGFVKENKLKIKYVYQPNSGKHVALNTGCIHAEGEYIFIVDSDDALTQDAIIIIKKEIKNNPSFVGYCFRKITFDNQYLGTVINEKKIILNPTQAGKVFKGDLAYVFSKTSMIENPFPVISGEKFVPELYIWNKIADTGDILFFPNEWIYVCEYLPDGCSMNFKSNLKNNPIGFALFYKDQINREVNFILKLKNLIRFLQCQLIMVTKK